VSVRDKSLLAVVAIIAAFGAGWFMIGKPKRAEISQLDQQIAAKQTEVDGVAARAAQYRAARDQLRKDPSVFAKAGRALPNRVQMPALLRTLTRTARDSGVEMADLTTGAGSSATAGINAVNLSLSFNGEFLDLQAFLKRLQKMVDVSSKNVAAKGRLLALNKVQLAPADTTNGGSALSAKVDATVYVLQPGALSAPAATATTPGAATPATPGAPAATPATPTAGAQP
jgi:Tfp pilus assembly protein PilO